MINFFQLLSGPITRLKQNKPMMQELRFMIKHMQRKSNEVVIMKCNEPRCLHCSTRPVKSVEAWGYLSERDFKWPNPIQSTEHPNHYKTFLEMDQLDNEFVTTSNDGLPCRIDLGKCHYCKDFVFLSDAEKKRHLSLFHKDQKGTV